MIGETPPSLGVFLSEKEKRFTFLYFCEESPARRLNCYIGGGSAAELVERRQCLSDCAGGLSAEM